jgi:hypothetical protein
VPHAKELRHRAVRDGAALSFCLTVPMDRLPTKKRFFTRTNLLQFLLAKSVAEALLVTGLGLSFYLVTTNPNLRGWLDQADAASVAGWVVDERNAAARVEVQLFIDDRFIEDSVASQFRPDVRQAQRANDEWHGFAFKTPPLTAGEHEARVYAVHRSGSPARRTLQLIGKPLRFRVD